jgi:3-phosphoshikimate 1-carboxyvinyltransferase
VRLPGSKSISNRILLLSRRHRRPAGLRRHRRDAGRAALLGVQWTEEKTATGTIHHVTGVAGVLPNKSADLFMGNAGTAIRPLTAALAVIGGDYTLHGVPRMHERPIGDLVDALNAAGTNVEYTGNPASAAAHQAGQDHHRAPVGARRCPDGAADGGAADGQEHAITIDVIGELISSRTSKSR